MKFQLIGIGLMSIFLCSCQFLDKKKENSEGSTGPITTCPKEIKVLNDLVYKSIHERNPNEILMLMPTDVAQKAHQDLGSWMSEVQPLFKEKGYHILENFHLSNRKLGEIKRVWSRAKDERKFSYQYKASHRDMYISLLLSNDEVSQSVLIVVYSKTAGQWKLQSLQAGQYAYFGMTAPHFFKRAKAAYSNHNLLDAATTMGILSNCYQPGGEAWTYLEHEEMKRFYKMIIDSANKLIELPLIVQSVPSKPYIYSIRSDVFERGIFPIVYYHSNISITDTAALRREYLMLKEPMRIKLNDLYEQNPVVIYRAFNQSPDSIENGFSYFGFVDIVDRSLN
jgi:hypothetical protein